MLSFLVNRSVLHSRRFIRSFTTQVVSPEITQDDEKRKKIIELEIELMRQEGRTIPEKITDNDWKRILELKSITARRKHLHFMFINEQKGINLKRKKEEKAKEREERLALMREENKSKHMVYGLGNNTIFLQIYDTTVNKWHNNKLAKSMLFSQKLVIDCSYDEFMTNPEASNAAKQLMYCFAQNRFHDQPFDLHFCNFDINTRMGKGLYNHIPTMFNNDFPMNVHKESFVDLFDKDRLVYLTPHCRNDITNFNQDDIYIVGAMVDKANSLPLSLAKAKKLGLRMAKLPIDQYMRFQGGKNLTINQMIDILLEVRITNDWKQALMRYVPRRKIKSVLYERSSEEIQNEYDLDEDDVKRALKKYNNFPERYTGDEEVHHHRDRKVFKHASQWSQSQFGPPKIKKESSYQNTGNFNRLPRKSYDKDLEQELKRREYSQDVSNKNEKVDFKSLFDDLLIEAKQKPVAKRKYVKKPKIESIEN